METDWRASKVSVLAKIPQRANLELSTTNNGEIIVRNIVGNLELQNTNGPITAMGISGSVIAESVNEKIEVDVLPTKPTVQRNDRRGGVEVRIESVIIANVNGGSPVIRLRTLHGDIHIREGN